MAGEANVWNPRTLIEISADTKSVEERITASTGQVLFVITNFTYVVGTGALEVHKNGLLLTKGIDWAEQTSTTFSLVIPATSGDQIVATGKVGITGTVDVRDTDIFASNYQAVRDYVGTETTLYSQSKTVVGDQGERFFQKLTGAATGFWVDNNETIIVPTGGDGSIAWISKSTTAFKIDTAAMVADKSLAVGMIVETSRYAAIRNGGGGRYDIIVSEATENLGIYFDLAVPGLQARLIPEHANVIDTTQFGVFADWLDGNTPQQVQMQRAIDAAPSGAVVSVPPAKMINSTQSSGYYFTATLVIAKYITLAGIAPTCGFQFGSLLIFAGVSGVEISFGYVTLADLQIHEALTPSVVSTDPSTNTWGTVGVHLGKTAPAVNFTMLNTHIGNFGTNLLSDSETFHDPYYKIINCKFFFGSINISLLGTFGGSNFVSCDIRTALQHGIYARATEGVNFDNCLLELNGTSNINFDTGLNPTYYGVFIQQGTATKADLHISNCYWENMSAFADENTRLTLHDNSINAAVRIFGAGDILYTGAVSPNLVSADIFKDWTFSNSETVTDQTFYTRIQSDLGTAAQASLQDFELANKLAIQDIKQLLISIDVRIDNGFQDGSFDVDVVLRIDQAGGGSDNTAQGTNWRVSNYDFTDGNWHTINYIHSPRFSPVGGLDPLDFDFSFLQTSIIFSSSDFSVNNLDARVRKPQVMFITDKEIGGEHPLIAGPNVESKIIQTKYLKLAALSGPTATWSLAIPAGTLVLAVTAKVTKTITGPTIFAVGDNVDDDLFIVSMGVAGGTTADVADSHPIFTSPLYYKAATDIVATAVSTNFTGGDVVLKLYYMAMIPPIF